MLLGKRPRPPIKRTTSMTSITFDVDSLQPPDQNLLDTSDQRFLAATVSPRYRSKNTTIETAHFLRTCGLCNHRLAPGRDIYMYRGEVAFCSLECREEQMKQDDRKEKMKSGGGGGGGSKKKLEESSASSVSKNETVAAA